MCVRTRTASSATSTPRDRARAGRGEHARREDADRRRLAGAVRPEQPEELAFVDVEVERVERDDFARRDRRGTSGMPGGPRGGRLPPRLPVGAG